MPGFLPLTAASRFGFMWTLQPASFACMTMRATHSNGGANAVYDPAALAIRLASLRLRADHHPIEHRRSLKRSSSNIGSSDSHLTAAPSIRRAAFSAMRTIFC